LENRYEEKHFGLNPGWMKSPNYSPYDLQAEENFYDSIIIAKTV